MLAYAVVFILRRFFTELSNALGDSLGQYALNDARKMCRRIELRGRENHVRTCAFDRDNPPPGDAD